MACPTGIEPVTPSLEGWCSIRLSYGQIVPGLHRGKRLLKKTIEIFLANIPGERFLRKFGRGGEI